MGQATSSRPRRLSELGPAVRNVASGGTVFPSTSMRAIRTALRRPSEREIEMLQLVAGGANEEIAERLVLSFKTIESHLRRLFDRYGVMNRTELAVLALYAKAGSSRACPADGTDRRMGGPAVPARSTARRSRRSGRPAAATRFSGPRQRPRAPRS